MLQMMDSGGGENRRKVGGGSSGEKEDKGKINHTSVDAFIQVEPRSYGVNHDLASHIVLGKTISPPLSDHFPIE